MLKDLGQSQSSFMAISMVNTMIASKTFNDISLLVADTTGPVIRPMSLTTSLDRIYGFDGLLIATNLYLASLLVNVPTRRKLFYIWDLEWLRDTHTGNYLENLKILQNPELTLIARSIEHADVIENYCNRRPDTIIPNFNLKMILDKYAF